MANQLDCISNIYCYKSKSNKNTKLIVNIIYYTIIFLPLIIGMTIGGIYGQKWKEDKYKNMKGGSGWRSRFWLVPVSEFEKYKIE